VHQWEVCNHSSINTPALLQNVCSLCAIHALPAVVYIIKRIKECNSLSNQFKWHFFFLQKVPRALFLHLIWINFHYCMLPLTWDYPQHVVYSGCWLLVTCTQLKLTSRECEFHHYKVPCAIPQLKLAHYNYVGCRVLHSFDCFITYYVHFPMKGTVMQHLQKKKQQIRKFID